MEKPKKLKEKHLRYLDTLRETGITNMYVASPYLMNAYPNLTKKESREILSYWMETFEN